MVVPGTNIGFPTKNHHFEVFWGKETPWYTLMVFLIFKMCHVKFTYQKMSEVPEKSRVFKHWLSFVLTPQTEL